jgi:hypothetical protein
MGSISRKITVQVRLGTAECLLSNCETPEFKFQCCPPPKKKKNDQDLERGHIRARKLHFLYGKQGALEKKCSSFN